MKKRYIIILILIIFLILNCKNSEIVAKIENVQIGVDEFKRFLADDFPNRNLYSTHEQRVYYLNVLINFKLKLKAAYKENLDEEPEILNRLKFFERREVYKYVFEKEVIEKVITDKLVRDRYNRLGKKVKLRHIFLPAGQSMDDTTKIKEQLGRLRSKIINGEDFSKIAEEVSKYPVTAKKGGELGYLAWGDRYFGDQFYETAFNMNIGEISHPIRTRFGFHIIQVEDRRTEEKLAFDKLKDHIRNRLYNENQFKIASSEKRFKNSVREHFQVTFVDKNIGFFISKVQEIRKRNKYQRSQSITLILPNILQPVDKARPLMEYAETAYTIEHFIAEAGSGIGIGYRALESVESLKKFLEQFIPDEELVIKWGYEKGYYRHNKIKNRLERKKEGLMVRKLERMKIHDSFFEPTEEEYFEYYSKHKDKYYYPLKTQVQEILVEKKALAEQIAQRAKNNEDFDELAVQYNERILTKKTKGMLGYLTKDKYGPIGEKAAQLDIGEVSDPIETEKGFSVIKILDKKLSRPKTFYEAIYEVRKDFRNTVLDALHQKWVAKLRENIKIQIFEDNLKRTF